MVDGDFFGEVSVLHQAARSKTEALLGIMSRRLCRLLIVYWLDGHAKSLSHPGREIVNRLTANPQLMGDAGIRRALH